MQGLRSRAKILVHGINFAPEMIGVAKYTTELVDYLRHQGHSVEVITAPPHYPGWYVQHGYRNRYSVESSPGLTIFRCPLLMRRNAGGMWRLFAPLTFALTSAPIAIWRILRSRPDVVVAVEPTLFSSPAALLAAKLIGARTVLHVQDLEIDAAFEVGHVNGNRLKKLGFLLERRLIKSFDRVVTISNKMRERLIAKGVKARKIDVIRNWVDLDRMKPMNRADNHYRNELGLRDKFVVLYSGHLGVKQGLGVLVDAIDRLKDEPEIAFVIVGEGPMKDELTSRAAGRPNIFFMPLQPAEKFCELLSAADLHVIPQQKGAADLVLPSKVGAILASGGPMVVTADAGTELHDMLTGRAVLVPAGNDESLATAIASARHQDFTAMVARGQDLVLQMSSRAVLPAFESILTGRAAIRTNPIESTELQAELTM